MYHLSAAELLDMPECLLRRYVEEMPRVRALWVLDAAQAAAYPHLGKHAAQWWQSWQQRAEQTARAVAAAFSFNGVSMGGRQIQRKLAQVLGGGFSE